MNKRLEILFNYGDCPVVAYHNYNNLEDTLKVDFLKVEIDGGTVFINLNKVCQIKEVKEVKITDIFKQVVLTDKSIIYNENILADGYRFAQRLEQATNRKPFDVGMNGFNSWFRFGDNPTHLHFSLERGNIHWRIVKDGAYSDSGLVDDDNLQDIMDLFYKEDKEHE